MAVTSHVPHALVEAGIAQADRGVASIEQPVDGLSLLETGESPVLPEYGSGVGERAFEALMAAAQGRVAELETLVEELPEPVWVPPGREGHVRQVDGHDALVEAAVVLGLARLPVAGVGHVVVAVARAVGRQERATAHAGVDITRSRDLAFRELVLPHLLL